MKICSNSGLPTNSIKRSARSSSSFQTYRRATRWAQIQSDRIKIQTAPASAPEKRFSFAPATPPYGQDARRAAVLSRRDAPRGSYSPEPNRALNSPSGGPQVHLFDGANDKPFAPLLLRPI